MIRHRHLFALAALFTAGLLAAAPAPAQDDAPGTVLITGSNRGIGLALAREYAAQGWRVLATCRTPARADELNALARANRNITVEALDVTNEAQIAALAERYRDTPIDVLLNNAAALGDTAAQNFGQLDYTLFARLLDANLVGPLRVSEAFLPHVLASRDKKIVILGSAAGAHGMLGPGLPLYAYRAGKAGLHLAAHQLGLELAPRGVIVGVLNPGIVDTKGVLDLKPGEPVPEVFRPILPLIERGELELMRPEEAAEPLVSIIDALTPEDVGRFINVDGQVLPW